jgi:GTP-binding protein Era
LYRAGFAALVGRPNGCKSSLLNALIGQKVSIVTPRPQTTRHRILGIHTSPEVQIVFVDTPGLHREAGRALNKAMNRTATAALEEADLVVLVVEPRWGRMMSWRSSASARPAPAMVANKIDLVRPRERLLPAWHSWARSRTRSCRSPPSSTTTSRTYAASSVRCCRSRRCSFWTGRSPTGT